MKVRHSVLALALFGLSGAASAGVINDEYWGAEPNGYGDQDVMGLAAAYDISKVDASLAGTILTVKIWTNFAGRAGLHPDDFWDPRDNTKKGIGYGDLFLARDWNPFGAGPNYVDDQYDNGTLWEYGFALDDSYSNTGGSGTLYQLTGATNADNAYLSNEAVQDPNTSRRDNQEILVKETNAQQIGGGDWWVTPDPDISDMVGDDLYPDTAQGVISFAIDLTGTSLLNELTFGDGKIALRWTMFCANDVFEGEVPVTLVPLPGSALLLGLGLAALGVGQLRRRKTSGVTA